MESCVLKTQVMSERHTTANMNIMCHAVAEEWGFNFTEVIVTDQGANMLDAALLEKHHTFCPFGDP